MPSFGPFSMSLIASYRRSFSFFAPAKFNERTMGVNKSPVRSIIDRVMPSKLFDPISILTSESSTHLVTLFILKRKTSHATRSRASGYFHNGTVRLFVLHSLATMGHLQR